MSRIGKVPVKIPSGVEVTISGQNVRVKGPKGELDKDFSPLALISQSDDCVVLVKPADNFRKAIQLWHCPFYNFKYGRGCC